MSDIYTIAFSANILWDTAFVDKLEKCTSVRHQKGRVMYNYVRICLT